MKKLNLFLAIFIPAVVFISCNKDNDHFSQGDTYEEAKLTIRVTSSSTRANTQVSDFDNSDDLSYDKINNFSFFITDQNDKIQWRGYSADGEVFVATVKVNAKYVYIVANGGDLTESILTKEELDAYKINLGTSDQTSVRWATGSNQILSFNQLPDGSFTGNLPPVELTFVAARITLVIHNGMDGYDATDPDLLVLKNVAILNARSQSKLFGQDLLVTPATYFSGISNDGFTYWPSSVEENEAIMIDAIPENDFSRKFYYYVFENDAITAATFPTIITICGEYKDQKVYYPVHLAPYEEFSVGPGLNGISRGNSYDITLTLRMDPDNPGGTPDPTIPVVYADMDLQVTLKPWIPVEMEKEFD